MVVTDLLCEDLDLALFHTLLSSPYFVWDLRTKRLVHCKKKTAGLVFKSRPDSRVLFQYRKVTCHLETYCFVFLIPTELEVWSNFYCLYQNSIWGETEVSNILLHSTFHLMCPQFCKNVILSSISIYDQPIGSINSKSIMLTTGSRPLFLSASESPLTE